MLFGVCMGITEYALMFLAIEPSTINRAIGGDAVGVVNVWHDSPATAYDNPAIAAFRDGFSLSYTNDNWLEGSGIDDMYYNCALVNIGYKGVGITLPAPNASGKLGINMDFGVQEWTDETGQSMGNFHSWEDAAVYGIAVNPIEITRQFVKGNSPLDYFDLAVGVNQLSITSNLGPVTGSSESGNRGTAKTTSTDIGFIAKVNYTVADYLRLEGVYGESRFNYYNKKISYIDAESEDPIYTRTNTGYALSLALLSEKFLSDFIEPRYMFFDNILTLRYLNGVLDQNMPKDITGSGTEIGFLDTFYYRSGRYDDDSGYINGDTKGWGINLHYKDIVAYNFNYASYPGGELTDEESSWDHNIAFNVIKILDMMGNK